MEKVIFEPDLEDEEGVGGRRAEVILGWGCSVSRGRDTRKGNTSPGCQHVGSWGTAFLPLLTMPRGERYVLHIFTHTLMQIHTCIYIYIHMYVYIRTYITDLTTYDTVRYLLFYLILFYYNFLMLVGSTKLISQPLCEMVGTHRDNEENMHCLHL